jgi:hypothetical protein
MSPDKHVVGRPLEFRIWPPITRTIDATVENKIRLAVIIFGKWVIPTTRLKTRTDAA